MAQETVAPGVENAQQRKSRRLNLSAPRPSGYVDVARTAQAEAADAERQAIGKRRLRHAEQHEALKRYQRELHAKQARRNRKQKLRGRSARQIYRVVVQAVRCCARNGLRTRRRRATA